MLKKYLRLMYNFYFLLGVSFFKISTKLHPCLICRQNKVRHLFKDLFICNDCRSIQKRPQPNKLLWRLKHRNALLSACFNKDISKTRMAEAKKQLIVLERFKNPGKLFDIGCNGGFFMKVAQDRGWEVIGNDISIGAVKWGRTNFGLNIMYGYLDDLNLNSDYYEAVNLWNVLEHTHNPMLTLKLCWNMIKKDGLLMVKLPSKNRNSIKVHYDQYHLFEWNETDSNELIEKVGFKK